MIQLYSFYVISNPCENKKNIILKYEYLRMFIQVLYKPDDLPENFLRITLYNILVGFNFNHKVPLQKVHMPIMNKHTFSILTKTSMIVKMSFREAICMLL